MIHGHQPLKSHAAAASASALLNLLRSFHAVVASQLSAEPSPLVSSQYLLPLSCSCGTSSFSWTNTSTGGMSQFAYSYSAHCWWHLTLLLDGSWRTTLLLENFFLPHKFFLWFQYSWSLPGIWFTSYSSTRKTHSTPAWVTSQLTLTPSNQRRPGSSPCSPRLLSLWSPSPTSSALLELINQECTMKVKLGLTQMPQLRKRKSQFLRKNPKLSQLAKMPQLRMLLQQKNERRNNLWSYDPKICITYQSNKLSLDFCKNAMKVGEFKAQIHVWFITLNLTKSLFKNLKCL